MKELFQPLRLLQALIIQCYYKSRKYVYPLYSICILLIWFITSRTSNIAWFMSYCSQPINHHYTSSIFFLLFFVRRKDKKKKKTFLRSPQFRENETSIINHLKSFSIVCISWRLLMPTWDCYFSFQEFSQLLYGNNFCMNYL